MTMRGIFRHIRLRGEYIVLAAVLAGVLGLLFALAGHTQTPDEIWTLPAYYPSPWGEYNWLACRQFVDYNNGNYILDPNGSSRLKNLRMYHLTTVNNGGKLMMNSGRITSTGGAYYLNLNSSAAPTVKLHSIATLDQIQMIAPTADPGKLIYDIAEGMRAAEEIEAGDVVCIAATDGALRRSTQPYDPLIAGVISADPKVYLGPGPGKRPLALSGVVACKASAENGAIAPGDLLVSAAVPGHAMRASVERVEPGMVVGKALEPLARGRGSIAILVNKQ